MTDADWFAVFDLLHEAGMNGCDRDLEAAVAIWIQQGRRFGYPRCCIRHFVLARLNAQPWHTREVHPLDERRMCDQCAARLERQWPNRPGRRFVGHQGG